ncbi:hypothetical protein MSUIS_06960 [Mycoplasma suis KI3806]|uniref:Uncharacterized protein n=1 Tax=Mycoplasma suis (strain KI_3806) TaxID=708248 RepID=F0V2A8_MYCS3|nr:hypothetical protein [Mycoplasma suis]CBZ40789.1 hypothetical protein MSUIS_06960 [Mycoplasma suis KI3806]
MIGGTFKIPLIVFSILSLGGGGGYLAYYFTKSGSNHQEPVSCLPSSNCKCCEEGQCSGTCKEQGKKCCKKEECNDENCCCCSSEDGTECCCCCETTT